MGHLIDTPGFQFQFSCFPAQFIDLVKYRDRGGLEMSVPGGIQFLLGRLGHLDGFHVILLLNVFHGALQEFLCFLHGDAFLLHSKKDTLCSLEQFGCYLLCLYRPHVLNEGIDLSEILVGIVEIEIRDALANGNHQFISGGDVHSQFHEFLEVGFQFCDLFGIFQCQKEVIVTFLCFLQFFEIFIQHVVGAFLQSSPDHVEILYKVLKLLPPFLLEFLELLLRLLDLFDVLLLRPVHYFVFK